MKKKLSLDQVLLLLILLVAAVLRFWNFWQMPFMHDELSALARTHYNNIFDEIYFGVAKYDTHPAGVQLFIYYLTKAFGENEMIVKFPFIIFGLLSIVMLFKISKFWFNASVGLIAAAFMAVMQYFVTYSDLARPYVVGVFFSLLMVWFWSNYFFNDSGNKKRYLIGYVITTACCAYIHHFALLFAIIVAITGLFFLKRTNWKGYLLAGLGILVLYIPHFQILFIQFGKGGLGGSDGWLGKPNPEWLLSFFRYSFHYSYLMYGLGAAVLALTIRFHSHEIKEKQKFRIIALVWFLAEFFIQYYYSLYVNPVIQFSTIIFVFPFFILFFFSLAGNLSSTFKIASIASILIIGSFSLVVTRKHMDVFYHQPYQQQVLNTYKTLDLIGDEKKATIELMIPPLYKEHYFKKYNREFKSLYFDPFEGKVDTKAFRKLVNEQTTDYFIFGCPPLEYLPIIKEKYPYLITKEEGFTYSYYCFAKQKPINELHEQVIYSKKMEGFVIDSAMEFGKEFKEKLKKMVNSRHVILNVSAQLLPTDKASNPSLVIDIQDNGKSINWFGADYTNFNTKADSSNTVYLSRDLTDFDFKNHPDAEIKIYIWNRNKTKLVIDNFNIEVIRANPLIYALFEPID